MNTKPRTDAGLAEPAWEAQQDCQRHDIPAGNSPKILILMLDHGASHQRVAKAVHRALVQSQPDSFVDVVNALDHCTPWFRAYYDSYEIPLRFWPGLWGWIEGIQHRSKSTGPLWLYRRGARPLFQFMERFRPDIVVATEVGLCELAAVHKRENGAPFRLVATELMDFNRAWIQPEVDLFLVDHEDLAAELKAAGAPGGKIRTSGHPIDPGFTSLPERERIRKQLQLHPNVPLLLVLFGGSGSGSADSIIRALRKLDLPLQVVFIAGKNQRLEKDLRKMCVQNPRFRAFGWVDNISEWMVAADLLLGKPGGSTLAEAFACGLPLLAFDPLPGNEQRTCRWIEKWEAGYWIRGASDLLPALTTLLETPGDLARLRHRARKLARPRAADEAAEAILQLWQPQASCEVQQAAAR